MEAGEPSFSSEHEEKQGHTANRVGGAGSQAASPRQRAVPVLFTPLQQARLLEAHPLLRAQEQEKVTYQIHRQLASNLVLAEVVGDDLLALRRL